MIIVGIDPGKTGAIAFLKYSHLDKSKIILGIHDMPTLKTEPRKPLKPVETVSRSGGKALPQAQSSVRIDPVALDDILRMYGTLDKVIIEDVWGMPGQSVTSTFALGHHAGVIFALAQLAPAVEVAYVAARTWKSALGASADKEATRRLASAIFGTDDHWHLKAHDGRAEAALIALWGIGDPLLWRQGCPT